MMHWKLMLTSGLDEGRTVRCF